MGRAISGVVVAFLLWTALWLGFGAVAQATFPEIIDPEQPLTHTGALLTFIAYSAIISIGAGFVCAAIRKDSPMRTVWVFAIIQQATGIGFEVSYWELTPVWYHLVFLALLVPATVWGGMLRVGRAGAVAEAA